MTTYTISSGYDTYVWAISPTTNYASSATILTGNPSGSLALGLVYLPLPADLKDATVSSATLSAHANASFTSQTVGVGSITSPWSASTATWNHQPTAATSVNTSVSSGSAGALLVLDATAAVQSAASGAAWYGLHVFGSTTLGLNSFGSGSPSWTLTIETTDAPEVPQSLVPNGTVVGSGAPVLTCDFVDNGGLTNDMAQMNVQVSTSTSFASPAYDHTLATTVPVFDLSANSFTAVSSGTTRYWRVRVQDTDGNWSGWSDPASFTYRTQPTITLNTPAAGLIYDPTTDVNATTSTNLSAYRVQITDGTDRTSIRFDSGRLPATPGALTTVDVPIPEVYEGTRVLRDHVSYQLHIRVWDTYSRQSTPGSPAHVDLWTTFTFADDNGVTPPTTLVATQLGLGPGVDLTWTRAAVADGWVILRDDSIINRSDGTDLITGVSTYTWTDPHPPQWQSHTWTVKAVTGHRQSKPSPAAAFAPSLKDLWLRTQDHQQVFISGPTLDQLTVTDRSSTYSPVNLRYDVDVVTARQGIQGTVSGTILTDEYQDAFDARATLLSIRKSPSTWVRMVYGTFSGKVLLRNVSVLPHPQANTGNQAMTVSFGVNQVGDFDSVI